MSRNFEVAPELFWYNEKFYNPPSDDITRIANQSEVQPETETEESPDGE